MPALLPKSGPARLLALATLVSMTGYGVYLTAGVLYFTRAVHLPAAQVGVGLTVGGAVSLAAGIPVGHLADRRGAHSLRVDAGDRRGVDGRPVPRASSSGRSCYSRASAPSRGRRATARAARSYRSSADAPPSSAGTCARSPTSASRWARCSRAAECTVNTRHAYVLLIGGSAVSYAASAVVVLFLPRLRRSPRAPGRDGWRCGTVRTCPDLAGWRDGDPVPGADSGRAAVAGGPDPGPKWSVSLVILINTAIVTLSRFGPAVASPPASGGRAFRRAGFAFLAAVVMISFMADTPLWLAMTLLPVAVIIHTVGEMWQAAGGFELSFALAPRHAVGQYQGLFGMGLSLGTTLGPVVADHVVHRVGSAGLVGSSAPCSP